MYLNCGAAVSCLFTLFPIKASYYPRVLIKLCTKLCKTFTILSHWNYFFNLPDNDYVTAIYFVIDNLAIYLPACKYDLIYHSDASSTIIDETTYYSMCWCISRFICFFIMLKATKHVTCFEYLCMYHICVVNQWLLFYHVESYKTYDMIWIFMYVSRICCQSMTAFVIHEKLYY